MQDKSDTKMVNKHKLDPSQASRYSIYLLRGDGRLSWPGWLVT